MAEDRQCVDVLELVAEFDQRLMLSYALFQRLVTLARVIDFNRPLVDYRPQLRQSVLEYTKLADHVHVQHA